MYKENSCYRKEKSTTILRLQIKKSIYSTPAFNILHRILWECQKNEHSTVIVLAVKWRGVVRTVRWARERHKNQGGSAFVHAITAFVGATTLTSADHPLAPTAVCPFGIIVRAWPSFPGSEIYITTCYRLARLYSVYPHAARCSFKLKICYYPTSNTIHFSQIKEFPILPRLIEKNITGLFREIRMCILETNIRLDSR